MKRALCWRSVAVLLLLSNLTLSASPAFAQADDRAVLAGLKEVKVGFDITTGDAKALLNRLNVIDETRQSLIKQGVTPLSCSRSAARPPSWCRPT